MRFVTGCLVFAASAFGWGCTFYTACPTGGPSSNSGGSGNPGGGGSGGNPIVTGPVLTGNWVNVTSNLANMASECGNLSLVSSKPDEDMLFAGIAQRGVWASTDGGDSWHSLGTGKDSAKIINRTGFIAYDPDDTNKFWEVGIYNPVGLYVTSDKGKTFEAVGNVFHNDYVSIDFTDPERKTMLMDEHEQVQKLLLSKDQGMTWTEIGQNIPPGTSICTFPYVIDATTFLLGCGVVLGGEGNNGVFKSTDSGQTWDWVSPNQGGASAPLIAADGSIYWVTQRGGGMVRSTDKGDTWTQVVEAGVITNLTPSELPDGSLAAMKENKILRSTDLGATWKVVTKDLPFAPIGFVYSPFRKAFYAWYFTCGDTVPPDGLMRYDFDYQVEP